MERPLYDKIIEYQSRTVARFHMPAHSGNVSEGLFASQGFDISEVEGLGNLLTDEGVINEAEQLLAKSYHVPYSLMLTAGSTIGNQIMVGVSSNLGGEILTMSDMHKSFWSACYLWNTRANVCDNIDEMEEKLRINNNISTIFITSPNYFGVCKDIKSYKKLAEKYGKKLFVDSAHGAHFVFGGDILPDNVSEVADMCVVSMHKTMPVYGGGAALNVGDKSLYDSAVFYRQLLHSTSPSYLTMASIDWARADFEVNGGKYYSKIKSETDKFKARLTKFRADETDDISRLVVSVADCDGADIACQLAHAGIVPEMTFKDKLVFIITPFNVDKLPLLATELEKVEIKYKMCESFDCKCQRAVQIAGKIEFIPIEKSLGRIAMCEVGIYPPGVPLLRFGDIINEKSLNFIKVYKSSLFGLVNNRLAVLQ